MKKPDWMGFQVGRKGYVFILSILLLYSCSSDDEEVTLTRYESRVIDYFKEVALGFELGTASAVTRKWVTPMNIFIGGNPSIELKNELTSIISEINGLASDGFRISVTADTLQSNCYIFFGSASEIQNIYPQTANLLPNNWGLFYVYFNPSNELVRSMVFIDIVRASDSNASKHLLREELTQSLGLAKDSFEYPESIFQQNWTTTTEYAEIDRDLIRLLYHPRMYSGLNSAEVDPLLKSLVKNL